MTRLVREQMLCILLPAWTGGEAPLRAVDGALREALDRSGVVHFATLALLPPRPGAAAGALPTLLIELALDEGLRPGDALHAVTAAAVQPLWQLLAPRPPDAAAADPGTDGARVAWLRQYLARHVNVADGAFVGARDRTVERIRQEQRLMQATREAAAALGGSVTDAPDTWAMRLADAVLGQEALRWAREPVPRSYWRQPGALVRWLLVWGVACFLALRLGEWLLLQGAQRALCWLSALPDVASALAQTLEACAQVARTLWRFEWAVVLHMLLPVALLLVPLLVMSSLLVSVRRALRRVDGLLDTPMRSRAAWLASLLVAAVLLLMLAELGTRLWQSLTWALAQADAQAVDGLLKWPWWLWYLVLIAVLLVLVLLATWRRRSVALAPARAHQVDASVQACETACLGGVQHMLSLTEVRSPLHAWWLRRSLRLISWVGHLRFTEGWLGGAWGIHFGHWHLIDEDRRLLFCSNYDGSFGGYLDDFIRGASRGVNAVWRHTELQPRQSAPGGPAVAQAMHFPRTRVFLWRGARCEQAFKAYARASMLPHVLRFAAYRTGLQGIQRASRLREALAGPRTVPNDDLIMRCLES